MESFKIVDVWAVPPLRDSSSSPGFDNSFPSIPPEVKELSSSDASSTSTLAPSSTTPTFIHEDASSSLRTTPELEASPRISLDELDENLPKARSSLSEEKTRRRSTRLVELKSSSKSAASSPIPTTPRQYKNLPTNASSGPSTVPARARLPTLDSRPIGGLVCDISGKTEPAGAVTRRCSQRVSTRLLEELKTEATLSSTAKRPYDAVSKDLRIMDKKRTGGGIDNKKAKFKHDGKTKDNTPFVGSTASSTVGSEGAEEVLKRKKIWLDQGLYVGQEEKRLKPTFGAKKLKNKQRTKAHALPLPIFAGQQILNTERDFKLPFFIFAQSNIKHAQPPPWRKLNHSL
jgi:hypothetical protein